MPLTEYDKCEPPLSAAAAPAAGFDNEVGAEGGRDLTPPLTEPCWPCTEEPLALRWSNARLSSPNKSASSGPTPPVVDVDSGDVGAFTTPPLRRGLRRADPLEVAEFPENMIASGISNKSCPERGRTVRSTTYQMGQTKRSIGNHTV